ncbi:hypothetical protein FB451DRAFT_1572730 [Mycena latifolia]|nr:hypothetical protein FB451DRAFT_1572730 [Mycena latifolia]
MGKAKVPTAIIDSSDSSDDEEDGSATSQPSTPVPQGKTASTKQKAAVPHIDLAAATPRPSRSRTSTHKVSENRKDADAKKDAKIQALTQQLKTAQKKNEKAQAELHEHNANHFPLESEEEDDGAVQMSSYSSSFVSKGIVGETARKSLPKKVLRKSSEAPIMTPGSRVPLANIRNPSNVTPSDRSRAPSTTGGDREGEPPRDEAPPPPRRTEVTSTLGEEEDEDIVLDAPPPPRRKRPRSSSPSKRSSPSKKARKRSKAVPELPKAQFVAGKAPGGSRTNLKDYTEPAARLIKRAMHKYEVRIWTLNPFPGAELQTEWVTEIWDEVCEEAEERMELTERMSSMVKKYGSHARSSLKDGIRPLVAPTYKFKVGDSAKIIKKNIKIWKRLLDESAFHYEDPATRTGYAANTIIIDGMRNIWFKTRAGRGILFFEYFSPISVVTLALVFTAIEFCIEEYSTGRFQQGIFDEVLNRSRYDTHLKDLTEWAALMPSVTTALRQQMHDRCRRVRASTGAALVKSAGRLTDANRARALQELAAMNVDGGEDADGEVDSD